MPREWDASRYAGSAPYYARGRMPCPPPVRAPAGHPPGRAGGGRGGRRRCRWWHARSGRHRARRTGPGWPGPGHPGRRRPARLRPPRGAGSARRRLSTSGSLAVARRRHQRICRRAGDSQRPNAWQSCAQTFSRVAIERAADERPKRSCRAAASRPCCALASRPRLGSGAIWTRPSPATPRRRR